ncbi:hypothetical protein GW766_01955 [Candidatus Parcubacteria bacterium]|nr:hypothetical protein [Candidatus Parcubacteria bacterium]
MSSRVFGLFLFAAAFAAFSFSLGTALDTPVVYQDALSRRCVAIEDRDGLRNCQRKPRVYEVAYVAPGLTYHKIERMRDKK